MGKFYWKLINNQQGMPYIAQPKREGMFLLMWGSCTEHCSTNKKSKKQNTLNCGKKMSEHWKVCQNTALKKLIMLTLLSR